MGVWSSWSRSNPREELFEDKFFYERLRLSAPSQTCQGLSSGLVA